MKEFLSQIGGRHLYNTDLKNLQELALSMQEIFKDCGGNFVISGCKCTSYRKDNMTGNYPEGYVYIDGKIRHVEAKENVPFNNLKIVAKERSGNSIPYSDGSYHPQYTEYYAEYENTESVDTPYIKANSNAMPPRFPDLSTYFFNHYTASKEGNPPTLPSLKLDNELNARYATLQEGINFGAGNAYNVGPHKNNDNIVDGIQISALSYNFVFLEDGSISVYLGAIKLFSLNPYQIVNDGTAVGSKVHGVITFDNTIYVDRVMMRSQHNPNLEYNDIENVTTPIGCLQIWAGPVNLIPSNYLLCDGSSYESYKYPELWNIIGQMYNQAYDYQGNKYRPLNEGQFRVPDLRGRFIVGYDPKRADYNAIGNVGGEKTHTLSVSEMPTHEHLLQTDDLQTADLFDFKNQELTNINLNYERSAQSYDGGWSDNGTFIPPKRGDVGRNSLVGTETFTGEVHKKNIKSETAGGSRPHENRPPYYTLAYIIRAK